MAGSATRILVSVAPPQRTVPKADTQSPPLPISYCVFNQIPWRELVRHVP